MQCAEGGWDMPQASRGAGYAGCGSGGALGQWLQDWRVGGWPESGEGCRAPCRCLREPLMHSEPLTGWPVVVTPWRSPKDEVEGTHVC